MPRKNPSNQICPLCPEAILDFRAMLPRLQKTIAKLQIAGVTLLAGSDIAGDRVPGFSLQDELKALGNASSHKWDEQVLRRRSRLFP